MIGGVFDVNQKCPVLVGSFWINEDHAQIIFHLDLVQGLFDYVVVKFTFQEISREGCVNYFPLGFTKMAGCKNSHVQYDMIYCTSLNGPFSKLALSAAIFVYRSERHSHFEGNHGVEIG